MIRRFRGHVATVGGRLRARLRPPARLTPETRVTVTIEEAFGSVRVSGALVTTNAAQTLVAIVPGLGARDDADYVIDAARAASALGLASLRVSLRGCDRSGDDFGHGGLTADLHALLGAPELASFERIVLLGYSIGGHVALATALDARLDSRVSAVGAIGSPLDLGVAARELDAIARRPYRSNVFRGLDEIYEAVERRRPVPTPSSRVRRARSAVERDSLTVVPRYAFESAAHYYDEASVIHRVGTLRVPGMLLFSAQDPVLSRNTIALRRSSEALTVHVADCGGHVYFPGALDLGADAPKGAPSQVLGRLVG